MVRADTPSVLVSRDLLSTPSIREGIPPSPPQSTRHNRHGLAPATFATGQLVRLGLSISCITRKRPTTILRVHWPLDFDVKPASPFFR